MAGILNYIKESKNELLNKVSWPSWKDLQSSAVIVLIATIIIALVIFVMDFVFGVRSVGADEQGWRGLLGFFYNMFK